MYIMVGDYMIDIFLLFLYHNHTYYFHPYILHSIHYEGASMSYYMRESFNLKKNVSL